MTRIPQDTIDRIRDSADIVDVVSHHVDLKKRGKNFFGLCPFHNEKTPSFSVAPDKGIYHCFGCGNGGNAVNFIMEIEKISFVETIEQLGNQLGIEVNFSGDGNSKEFFGNLYEIHEVASKLYSDLLFSNQGQKAKEYLLNRGLNEESLKLFKVGFAPANSSFLFNSIKDKNYDKEILEKSGLFGFSNSQFYDRFRSRIMFPISNIKGKVIAFGGRVFGKEDPAKYMNSPETPLYKKSEVFYGLNLTRDAILKKESAVLVEGYTDLIQLFQAGIKNVIAVSGTAFNNRHVDAIRRFTSKVYLSYDGDQAGINAAKKAGFSLLKGGLDPKIIIIPKGLDPDDWVKKEGASVFISEGIEKAYSLLNFYLKTSNFSKKSPSDQSKLIKEILTETLEIQDPIIKQDIVKSLAQVAGVEENQILQMLTQQIRVKRLTPKINIEKSKPLLFNTVQAKAELGIIKVLISNNAKARILIKEDLDINQIQNDILKKIIEILMNTQDVNPAEIIEHFDSLEDREIISKTLIDEDNTSSPIEMAEDCLNTISNVSTRKKIKQMRIEIRQMESENKDPTDLMKKIIQMQKKLHA